MKKLTFLILSFFPMYITAQTMNISIVEISGGAKISNTAVATGNNSVAVAGVVANIHEKQHQPKPYQTTRNIHVNVQNGEVTTNVHSSGNQNHCGGVVCIINR